MWKNRIIYGLLVVLLLIVAGEYYWINKISETKTVTVASIDGNKITEQDLYHQMKKVYGQEVLNEMINRLAIKEAAKKYNIKADKKEIEREYNKIREDYSSEDEFIAFLNEQMGMSKEELNDYIEYYILWEEIATKDIEIPGSKILEQYNNNIDLYRVPEKYHLQQIVVKTKEEANQVLDELENGSDFNTLAKERSIDVFTMASGGDLGFISGNDISIDDAIVEKARKMNENDLEIVRTLDGYAVIKLIEKRDSIQYSFDEVKNEIKREIALEQVTSLTKALEDIKNQLDVKVIDPELDK